MKLSDKIFTLFIVAFILMLIFTRTASYDTTDNQDAGIRSGLTLYIDHATGCHYLSTGGLFSSSSSLVPRLNRDGKHVCIG